MNRKEINTMDKYEGHTPAPWAFKGTQGLDLENKTHAVVMLYDDPRMRTGGKADMQLIADAPLILQALIDERAEVKRLRSILGYIKGIEMDWGIDFNHASITVTHFTGLMLSGELKLEMMD